MTSKKKIAILTSLCYFILFHAQLKADDASITNEEIYRELKIFEAKTDERFKAIDQRFEQIDKRFEQIDKRFEDVNSRFGDMFTLLWIITGIFTTLTSVVIAFAYWDRRTIIKKAKEETIEEIERVGLSARLLSALRELSKEDRKLADILKRFNLL